MDGAKQNKQVTVTLLDDGDIEISLPEGLDMQIGDVLVLLTLAETKVKMAYFANRLEIQREPQ